jgi:ubiquinone/menaquinone biosynthesis C-methylase UbiE
VVGGEGGQGGGAAWLTASLREAYDAAAPAWADGAERLYLPLATALVGQAEVAGRRVLDLGAGTGVAGRAALAAGARGVVAADLAVGMLRRCEPPLRPVAADALRLPFRDHSFDLVLAAFSLGHLPSLDAGLREARRVGAAVAVSSFAPGWTDPAKEAVEAALRPFGYLPPAWYVRFKQETEPAAGDPGVLAAQLAAAGFAQVRIRAVTVRTGLSAPAERAAWRLGMAHVAPFMSSLRARDAASAEAARQAAEQAVATSAAGPLTVSLLVTTAS